jgi:hypothetical protein
MTFFHFHFLFVALRVVSDLFFWYRFYRNFSHIILSPSCFGICLAFFSFSFLSRIFSPVHLFICYTQPHRHPYILAASVSSELVFSAHMMTSATSKAKHTTVVTLQTQAVRVLWAHLHRPRTLNRSTSTQNLMLLVGVKRQGKQPAG